MMEKLKRFAPYIRFGIVALIYVLVVVWVGNYWWLLGLPVLFDFYVTHRVRWLFLHKEGVKKQKGWVEWLDALLFATVAALLLRLLLIEAFKIPSGSMEKTLLVGDYIFVSKVSYGPKIPNTPLRVPFTQHTMPFSERTPSFSTAIQRPYNRRPGLGSVERGDVVVFQFPEGDTVILEHPQRSYYTVCREIGRDYVHEKFHLSVRPVDCRENYIKRCVAIPGDTLQIRDGQLYINSVPQPDVPTLQYVHELQTNGVTINPRILDELGIYREDRIYNGVSGQYTLPLTASMLERLRALPNIISGTRYVNSDPGLMQRYIFPHDTAYRWTEDQFGPLVIPQRGQTIRLTTGNLPLYRRIISVYEGNRLEVSGDTIRINGRVDSTYTFGMDYFWMMGDNRHHSLDSRFWGFVPEDHVEGKALFIWFSKSPEGHFPSNIRWSRIFSRIK